MWPAMRLNWTLFVHGCSGTRLSNPPHVVVSAVPCHPTAPPNSMRMVWVGATWAHVARVSRMRYGWLSGTTVGLNGSNSSLSPGPPAALPTLHTRPSGRTDITWPLKYRRA